MATRSKLDSSDIAKLEKELEEETKKCHSVADEAIPLAIELRKKTKRTDKFEVEKNGTGTIVFTKCAPNK